VARRLGDWLAEHPEARVTVLCSQFDSRGEAYVFRSVLGAEKAGRVRWLSLPDSRHDVTNWWHSRQGALCVLGSHVALLHTYLVGEPPRGAGRWDPEEYERRLRGQTVP